MQIRLWVWMIRITGILVSILVIGGSLSYRLGGRVPGDFFDLNSTAVIPELWQVARPSTWLALSNQAVSEKDWDRAKTLAMKALSGDISNGLALAHLMELYDKAGEKATAEKLLQLASGLSPANSLVRARLADHWLKEYRLDLALEEWSRLLTRSKRKEVRGVLFPVIYSVAADPASFNLLLPYLNSPPSWWDSFYRYMARQKDSAGLLNAIYQARARSNAPLSLVERRLYVSRLLADKQWQDAYFVWLSGLDEQQMKLDGLLYDGGFEGSVFNTGYDWGIRRTKGVKISTANTSGVSGRRALRVVFNTKKLNFQHVSQRLKLVSRPLYFELSLQNLTA